MEGLVLGEARSELDGDVGRLVPGLFSAGKGHPEVAATPEDRFRQFEAVSRLLREVSRLRPLVLVLDDLHWADTSTLLLLRHVVRSLGDERLLLVANARSTDQRHGELLGRIAREPGTTMRPNSPTPGTPRLRSIWR